MFLKVVVFFLEVVVVGGGWCWWWWWYSESLTHLNDHVDDRARDDEEVEDIRHVAEVVVGPEDCDG